MEFNGNSTKVASLNTNGLTAAKLTELLWLQTRETIDVFILVGVRCSARQLHFLGRTARSTLGLGSWTLSSPSRGMTPGAPCARSDLVGGQLIMVSPRWGGSIRTSHPDPTGLGILTEFVIGTLGGDIQIMGTYFPCPSTHTVGPTNRLWDKTQAWLGGQHIAESPQQYLQRQIQTRSLRHLSKAATGDTPLRNISLIGGDFNATWDGHHGPLRGLGHWAATSSLLSPLAALTSTTPMVSTRVGPLNPSSTISSSPNHVRAASHGGVSSLGHTSVTSRTTARYSSG